MLFASSSPTIYFAQIQHYRHGSRLDYLVQEWQGITDLLKQKRRPAESVKPLFSDCLSKSFFTDKKQREKVSILHLQAHQTQDQQISFSTDVMDEVINLHKLSRLVNYLPNLKLVFLSGYASMELLDQLFRLDIPAIITVEANHVEAPASPLTKRFYRSLAKGLSIRESFDQLTFNYGSSPKCYLVEYDLESDELSWEGKKQLKKYSPLPWGLYVLEDHLDTLNWAVPRKSLIPKKLRRKNKQEGGDRGLGMAMVLGFFLVMAAGLAYSIYPHIFGS